MNAWIAENVMGWVWRRSKITGNRCLYDPTRIPDRMDRPARGDEKLVWDWEQMSLGDFSTDDVEALAVVANMRARGFCFRINATAIDAGAETWSARFWMLDDPRDSYDQLAATAAHAICLAALAALTSEEPAHV